MRLEAPLRRGFLFVPAVAPCVDAPFTIALCLLATPALADVAGVASVKRAALDAYAGHIMGVVS